MMYCKEINGRQVFSDCRTIQTEGGLWISNPTAEQIAAAGWQEYTPPEVVPTPQTEPDMGAVMEAVKAMLSSSVESLTDEEALQVAALYPTWAGMEGTEVAAGDRLWYDGRLWKVTQAHTVQSDWTPDTAVSLFTEVSLEEWPEFVQPTGAHDAYMAGDRVTYEGIRYVCLIDGCVWSPSDYPQGWEARP